jgi:hypothetical protein
MESLKSTSRFEKLLLRVFEMDHHGETWNIIDSFDIPIKFTDNSWYINLPRSGRSYSIVLISRVNHEERELCRSNSIHSPDKTMMSIASREKIYGSVDETMLILSGIYDYLEISSLRENIPHRIIAMVDNAGYSVK